MNYQYDEEIERAGGIDLDRVVGPGTRVEYGRYTGKLASVEIQHSNFDKAPKLLARYEITEGPYRGMDVPEYYPLMALPPKKPGGPWFAPGLAAIKAAFAAIKAPVPKPFPLDAERAKKAFAMALGRKSLLIDVVQDHYKDRDTGEMKEKRVVRIIGLANAPATVDDLEDAGLVSAGDGLI
jgi:hypothetical protein